MKNLSFNRAAAARWQLHLSTFPGLRRLAPQRIARKEPTFSEEEDDQYAVMLRRREHWLGR